MSRLLMCGWESGSIYEAGVPVLSAVNASKEAVVAGRNGSYGLRLGWNHPESTMAYSYRGFSLAGKPSEVWVRFGLASVYFSLPYAGSINSLFALMDGSTAQIQLGVQATTGQFRLYRGTTLLDSGGTAPMGSSSPYCCIEVHAIIHASAGTITVWQDGKQIISYTGDTMESSLAQITDVRLGLWKIAVQGSGGAIDEWADYDDFAVNNTSGTVNNGRIGQGGIFAIRPTADTADADFTPSSGGDHYAMVDEIAMDGDTTYLTGTTSGDMDVFEMGNIANGQIDALASVFFSRVASGAGRALGPVLRSGGTTEVASAFYPVNTYTGQLTIWETDPNTDAAWTLVAVNSVQCGVMVVN